MSKMESMSELTTYLKYGEEEQLHELWATPIVTAKPFSEAFLAKLRIDIQDVLNGPGQFNATDLWLLDNLPESLLEVKEKILELTEKYWRKYVEIPLPKFHIAKGYFREVKGGDSGGVYRISPHKHSMSLGVSAFYITADKRNAGNLILQDPRAGVNWLNQFSAYKRVPVEEGLLIIHPGYLVHFVEPTDYTRPVYDYRLALISNIHRNYEEFLKALEENEDFVTAFGAQGITPQEQQSK